MEVSVEISSYGFGQRRFFLREGCLTIESGVLSRYESAELAKQLRKAAYALDDVDFVTRASAMEALDYVTGENDISVGDYSYVVDTMLTGIPE